MPIVSVVMLCHRVTPYLTHAIGSVLGQTFRDLELILVDNGTGGAAASVGRKSGDPRVHVISLPSNAGIAHGHNAGVARASGEYVALLDHDDIALPLRLERQVAALRADEALGLVGSRAENINRDGVVTGEAFALLDPPAQVAFSAYTMPAATPSYTGRTEVFRRFAFRPEFRLAADYDFFARAAEQWRVRALDEPLLQYRVHEAQATHEHYTEQMINACAIRLLTARRRAGRPEHLPETVEMMQSSAAGRPDLGTVYQQFARACLAERFPLLAVYHARRAVAVCRRPRNVALAAALWARAMRCGGADRGQLTRMFLGGPLRAHQLRRA